jgi:hypothetical protein
MVTDGFSPFLFKMLLNFPPNIKVTGLTPKFSPLETMMADLFFFPTSSHSTDSPSTSNQWLNLMIMTIGIYLVHDHLVQLFHLSQEVEAVPHASNPEGN